jgi:quinol monooxygenase YgiN
MKKPLLLVCGFIFFFAGCTFFFSPLTEQGNLTVHLPGSPAAKLSTGAVSRLWYSLVFSNPEQESLSQNTDPGVSTLTVSLAPGNWHIDVEARDGDYKVGSGSTDVRITAGQKAAADILIEGVPAAFVFTAQPQSAVYTQGATPTALSVTVDPVVGGSFSFEWYETDSTNNYSLLNQVATTNSHTPSAATPGIFYYFARVTNTSGMSTEPRNSSIAVITVNSPSSPVNAETPVISGQPQSATYTQNTPATPLSVTASVSDGGTLSYQWYSNTDNSNAGSNPVGTDNPTYAPLTTDKGTVYYYVEVTNTNNGVSGIKTATATSNAAAIEVTENTLTHAAAPSIDTQPAGASYVKGATTVTALTVTASVTDSGTLSYQWYSNASNSNSGGTLIGGADSSTYMPSTATMGTVYYYVTVTNTNSSVNGNPTAAATSNAAAIEVLVHAATPSITDPAGGVSYVIGATTVTALSVTASSSDGGTLSYQWYSNTTDSNSTGTPTPVGTNSSSHTPSTASPGTLYYYVTVTNTKTGINGDQTATKTSDTAAITVMPALGGWTGITPPSFGTTEDINAICYEDGYFFVGGGGGKIFRSANGITGWTAVATGVFTSMINKIARGNSNFVAVGSGELAYSVSGNSTSWTKLSSPPLTDAIYDVIFADNRYIICGRLGKIAYSTDSTGTSWTSVTSPFGSGELVNALAYGNNRAIAVGGTPGLGIGKIAYSADYGVTWTTATLPPTTRITAAAFGNGVFVAGSTTGEFVYSTNGSTWYSSSTTIFSSDDESEVISIAFGNGYFIAVGERGNIAYSTNGQNWTAAPSAHMGTIEIRGIGFGNVGNGRFIIGSASGVYGGKMAYADLN